MFLCIVNCVQAGGNETGLLPGMSKTSFEKILKRTSENIKKKRASADILNFMEMDNMKKSQNAGEKLLSIRGNMGVL